MPRTDGVNEQNLAEENLTLFLHCFVKGHPALQTIALQVISDILITHPSLLTPNPTTSSSTTDQPDLTKQIHKTLSRALKSPDPAVQSTAATTLAKTFLTNLITSTDLLKQLVIAYFDPDTSSNAHLRQSLSYFFPVYCHSRVENAQRMMEVACAVVAKLAVLREGLMLEGAEGDGEEDGAGGMVKLGVVGGMVVEWTDPRKILGFANASAGAGAGADTGAGTTHFLLAERVLDRVVTCQVGKEERKVLFSMLGKLHLPSNDANDGELLKSVLSLLQEAIETKVATDVPSRNTLSRLLNELLRMVSGFAEAERNGGGVGEETVVDSTEVLTGAEEQTEGDVMEGFDEEAAAAEVGVEDEEEEEVTALQRTIGATTIGAPDAEGTRVQLGEEDTEMMDVDGEEYTEI